MSSGPQVICAKCGAESSGLLCVACGGALIKICGNCQARNAVVKNFCDACGTDLSPQAPPADPPPVEAAPRGIGPPVPLTGDGGGFSIPKAGRSEQAFAAPVQLTPEQAAEAAAPPRRPKVPGGQPLLPSGPQYFVTSVAALLFISVLLGGTGLFFLHVWHLSSPEVLVPQVGQRYLEAVRINDYATAYGMLSKEARAQCSLDQFRLLRDTVPWTWSNITVAAVEPQVTVLQYDLTVRGQPSVRDGLVFVKEQKSWVRPYDGHLIKGAQEALQRANPDTALMIAQQAVRMDPRDPIARAYVCESLHAREVAGQVESQCLTALATAGRYPSRITPRALFRLHAILAQSYEAASNKRPEAIQEYTAMLSLPGLSSEESCAVLRARSRARLAMRDAGGAAEDREAAEPFCRKAKLSAR